MRCSGPGAGSPPPGPAARRLGLPCAPLSGGLLGLALLACLAGEAEAARIGALAPSSLAEQVRALLRLEDPVLRIALGGGALLGANCGLLGGFLLLRRLSLMGDTLGHAALPGVALAYMFVGHKAVAPLLLGAAMAGLAGAAAVWAIPRVTHLKEDTAMGLVLSSFFGAGLVLISILQKRGAASASGLDRFLLGQAAALGGEDLAALLGSLLVSGLAVAALYKELEVATFDPLFARSLGLPVGALHATLMGLVILALVVALPAVGAVLVAAMLVLPAATAHLLADRMAPYLALSALLGASAGIAGAAVSSLGSGLPTGPLMVLAGGGLFLLAWLFSPTHGQAVRRLRRWRGGGGP